MVPLVLTVLIPNSSLPKEEKVLLRVRMREEKRERANIVRKGYERRKRYSESRIGEIQREKR